MIASKACQAAVGVPPFRLLCLVEQHIIHLTHLYTSAASYASASVNTKSLVCNEHIMKETANDFRLYSCEASLMHLLKAPFIFADNICDMLYRVSGSGYLLLLPALVVNIHERQSHITFRHLYGECSGDTHA